jgi:Flp pilus assembly protein TadB
MEEMRRRSIEQALLEEERWESLSDEEREKIRLRKAKEEAETQRRAAEAAKRAELAKQEHRNRIESYEGRHGGSAELQRKRLWLVGRLEASPEPTVLSEGGTLLVLAVAAFFVGATLGSLFRTGFAGLIAVEILSLFGWCLWVHLRRERRKDREDLSASIAQVSRRMGCGRVTCGSCYSDRGIRPQWEADLTAIEQKDGCGFVDCAGCYSRR